MKEKIEAQVRELLSKIPFLKDRLPFLKGDDDLTEGGTTEVDIDDVAADADDDQDQDDEADSAEEAKKKKRTLIIRVVAGLLFAYLAYDFLMNDPAQNSDQSTEEQVQAPSAQEQAIAEKRRQRQEAMRKAKEEQQTQEAPVVTTDTVAEQRDQAIDQTIKQIDTQPTTASVEAVEAAPVAEAAPVETTEAPVVSEEVPPPASNEEMSFSDEQGSQVSSDVAPPAPTDVIQKEEKYTPAPDYEERGRGLVYNCVGKHWACVNRKAYFQCRKNERWQKQVGKALECHLDKTYSSDEDCETMQKYKINTNAATDFCGG